MSTGQNNLPNAQDGLRAVATAFQQMVFSRQAVNAALVPMRSVQDVSNAVQSNATRLLQAMDSQASQYSQALTNAVAMFAPTVGQSGLGALFTYMADNGLRVKSRGTVYGSPANSGSNVGNQILQVASKDYLGLTVESATIENLTFRLVSPSFSLGDAGIDTYRVTGEDKAAFSAFQMEGAGATVVNEFRSIAGGVTPFIANPSFDQPFVGSGGSDVLKIPSWLIVSGATAIARTEDDEAFDRGGSQASLSITGNCKLRFNFRASGVQLPTTEPFIAGLMWKSTASAGTITVRVGSVTGIYTGSVATTNTGGVWQRLVLDPAVAAAWSRAFDTDGEPVFEIEVSSYTSGTISIDDVIFNTATNVGGRWCAIVSGAVQGIVGDTHTHAVTLTTGADGTGRVQLLSGASGSVDSITVDGVELLRSAVPFNTSLNQTAADVTAEINDPENMTSPQYRATVASNTITIRPIVPREGTLLVDASATTITTTESNITGGFLGTTQDTIVRSQGTYLPHGSTASAGWEDA